MNAITKTEKPSLIAMMAAQRNMDPEQFAKTVRATVMPANHTNEQFAALMLVASKYDLDPILKEIYAFPAKGGGIVPIVSIDGWINLVNSHPQSDGFEFDFEHDDKGGLVSCTCRMFRKDRSRAVAVTEYLSECIRQTDPWKMKHRMLRHKAMIQAARLAFGFSGVYDDDEGAKIAEMREVNPQDRPQPPKPPVPPRATAAPAPAIEDAEVIDQTTGEIIDEREIVTETGEATETLVEEAIDDSEFLERLEADLAVVSDAATLEEVWTEADPMARFEGNEDFQSLSTMIRKRHLKRVGGGNG